MTGDGGDVDDSGAVIVCTHVAEGGFPILRAIRDEPVEPEDSGWQFTCNLDHTRAGAKVWSIADVLRFDESVAPLLNAPCGSAFIREGAQHPGRPVVRDVPE
jgi:hypothetical protein